MRAEEARRAASAAMESTAVAAKKAAEAERQAAATPAIRSAAPNAEAETKAAAPVATAAGVGNAAAKGIERLDGSYVGRMCSINPDGSPRCWGVPLTVQRGALSATWTSRSNNEPAHAKGMISGDGSVKFALDGTRPMAGRLP